MVDRQVGEIVDLLQELDLAENTIVFFSGDNGGNDYFKSDEYPRGLHGANVNPETGEEFRGTKGTLYEGIENSSWPTGPEESKEDVL